LSLLLVCRWRGGRGPAGGQRYGGPDGGLFLAAAGEDAVAPAGAEQASLYRPWQGAAEPAPGFLDGAATVVLFAVDVAQAAAAAWDEYYRDEHFPAVLALPAYAAGGRFRLHRRLREDLGRDPEWLTLYQLSAASEEPAAAAAAVAEDWRQRGEPFISNRLWARYAPA
jgi:hypothetical protein